MGMFVKLDRSILEKAAKAGRSRDTSWMPAFVQNLQELVDEDIPGSYELDEDETKGTIRNRLIKSAEFMGKALHFIRTSTSKDGKEVLRFEVIEASAKPAPVKRGPRKPKTEVIDATNVPELVPA